MPDRSRSLALAAILATAAALPQALASQGAKIVTGVSHGSLVESSAPLAMPTADEVFARHVRAIGGKDAVLGTTAIKTVGKMEMPAQGISALMESVAAPHKSSMKLSIPGIGDITNGFDGEVAWEVNPLRGPRIKTDKEKATALEDSDFRASMLFAKERYSSVECVGQTEFGGEKTWHVKTVLKSGRVVNEFFSIATGFRVGSQTTSESQAGIISVSTRESEYKQFGALKLATRTEMTTGAQKVVLTLTDVVLGILPDSAFALPAAVKALVKP
ncbi:MAG: hypothetical protein H7Z40_12065 [Phycisphaerae bacterium]|nr:hypothetical protein [Gemmatimonadaceae bacterium]